MNADKTFGNFVLSDFIVDMQLSDGKCFFECLKKWNTEQEVNEILNRIVENQNAMIKFAYVYNMILRQQWDGVGETKRSEMCKYFKAIFYGDNI